MPSFNFLKAFNKGQSKKQRAAPAVPIQTYPIYPEHSTSSTSSHSRKSASAPVEIIKSQPITDSTLDRRGTIKRKNKLHRHRHSDDTTHNAWATDPHLVPPGRATPPPPSLHPIAVPEQPLNKPASSIYPDEYPYPYDDHYHRRLQSQADEPIPGGMPGFHEGSHHEFPRGTHDPKSIRHRGHPSVPFPHFGEVDGPPPMTNLTHSSHGSHHTARGHAHTHGHGHGHERSRGRAGSWTPIPAVHRESDGNAEALYADHPNPGVHFEDEAGPHQHHSLHAHEATDGHHSQGRIGWIPENKLEERMNDPDAIPILNESHPHHVEQHAYPPVEQHHHRVRSSGPHDPLPRNGVHDPAGLYAHHGEPVSHNGHRAPHEGNHHRGKVSMYNDYHASEREEPAVHRVHRHRSLHDDSDREPEEYRYIVPFGRQVIFKDRQGREITRIGYPGPIPQGYSDDMVPFTVIDEVGNILFRHKGLESSRRHRDRDHLRSDSGHSHHRRRIKVIMIDENGNQVPMKNGTVSRSSRSHHSGHSRRRDHH